MSQRLRHGVLFAFLFLAFLLAQLPIQVALNWLAPTRWQIAGPAGTPWQGSTEGIRIDALSVNRLRWSLQPLSLLTLTPAWRVSGTLLDANFTATVGLTPSGRLHLTELAYANELAVLLQTPWLQNSPASALPLQGRLSIEIQELTLDADDCEQLQGVISLDALESPLARWAEPLLPLSAQLSCEADALLLALKQHNDSADLQATLKVGRGGDYHLKGMLKPGSADYRHQLRALNLRRSASGDLLIDQQGRLKQGA